MRCRLYPPSCLLCQLIAQARRLYHADRVSARPHSPRLRADCTSGQSAPQKVERLAVPFQILSQVQVEVPFPSSDSGRRRKVGHIRPPRRYHPHPHPRIHKIPQDRARCYLTESFVRKGRLTHRDPSPKSTLLHLRHTLPRRPCRYLSKRNIADMRETDTISNPARILDVGTVLAARPTS